MEQTPPPILVLVRDLIFASKIASTAAAQGVPLRMLRDPADLPAHAAHRLIVDLNQPGAMTAAAQWATQPGREVVGFVSHTDAQAIAAARQAGITRILPRSRFVQDLPELLRQGGEKRPFLPPGSTPTLP